MNNAKKWLAMLLLAFTMLIPIALSETVDSECVTLPDEYIETSESIEVDLSAEEAFEGYFNALLGLNDRRSLTVPRFLGGELTGQNRLAYDELVRCIEAVVAGERESTAFRLTPAILGLSGKYTAADLGVTTLFDANNKVTDEAKAAMRAKWAGDFVLSPIWRSLLLDHPYEMYWFDKTKGVKLSSAFSIQGLIYNNPANNVIYFNENTTHKTISFTVAAEFALDTYTFNTAMAQAAQTAAQNAAGIVADYALASDYEKLLGYKNAICDLNVYNSAAANAENNIPYGNPWQAVWVFDGDETTTVLCEGYAKAFQYLCDMTAFDDDGICCCTVDGTLNGTGHMWNIVRMSNGKNYLVDVTNCDKGSIGFPNKLFLAGSAVGSVAEGYTLALRQNLLYAYNQLSTLNLFSAADLTLSPNAYVVDTGLPIDASRFPDSAFRAAVVELCDTDRNNVLDINEISAVTALDVSGRGIAALDGMEHLTALTSLNCADNALTALNLAAMPKLTALNCAGNPLDALDVSQNAVLTALVKLDNRVISGTEKRFSAGENALTCDLGVRVITGSAPENVLNLPGGILSIDDSAFMGVAAEAVIVPEGCESIGSMAFADCPNLSEITIPESVTGIADDAFADSPDVYILSPSADVRQWAASHGIGSAAE